jgi:hypothetical protein
MRTTCDTEVELQLWTREGPTIAGLVVEYINTIMEDRATPALPKRSLGTSASDGWGKGEAASCQLQGCVHTSEV